MEGSKTIANISQKTRASLNVNFEPECVAESAVASAQYVSARRSNLAQATNDSSAPAQNFSDNNGGIFNQSTDNFNVDRDTSNNFSQNLFNNGLGNKTNKIKQIIESAISSESKQTVAKILDQVNQLSIAEKLLLYLKLPTGRSQDSDPLRQPLNPLGSRFEIHQTITWIKTHLEEDQDISLPKQDIYDEYIAYCDSIEMKPLSTADFGKVMKQVFPRVRPRRLGTRGNSRYCYAGMRKRVNLDVPLLPDLGEPNDIHCPEDETFSAASCLIREWAEKLLSVRFDNLQDLACHLVGNLCVDSRSVAAFTLMSTLEPRKFSNEKDVIPLLLPSGGQPSKHRETQLQLQRKLQEREVIREQKRKMQDHQSSAHRAAADKPRVKRSKLSHQTNVEDISSTNLPKQLTNPTPEHFTQEHDTLPPMPQLTPLPLTWQNNNCDIETTDTSTQSVITPEKSRPLSQAWNGSGSNSKRASDEVFPKKTDVAETSQVGFGQNLQIPIKSTEDARNGGDLSKVGSHAQCQNQTDIQNLYDVPNKNKNVQFSNRPPVTNVKSRHLSLDFEPNLSQTKISGRNSAMGHNEVLKSEKSKSSLRDYLETLPMKKARKAPPVQDLSKEFAPNGSKKSESPNLSPDVVQKQLPGPLTIGTPSTSVAISPPPAKVPIPRLVNPNKKMPTANFLILPSVPIIQQKSPRKKYKLIQPKVGSPTDKEDADVDDQKMGKEGSAFVPPKLLSKNISKEKLESNKFLIQKSPKKTRCNNRSNSLNSSTSNFVQRMNGHSMSFGLDSSLGTNMSPPVTENIGNLASIAENDAVPLPCTDSRTRLSIIASTLPPRTRNEVSIGCLEKDALDDYLHGDGNSQEQEEELMQYFQHDGSNSETHPQIPSVNSKSTLENPSVKCDKLSQLRLLLERNLTSNPPRSVASSPTLTSGTSSMSGEALEYMPSPTNHSASHSLSAMSQRSQMQIRLNKSNLVLPSLLHGVGYSSNAGLGTRRRVSFETSVLDHPENSVPQSPNTRRRTFNFTPITAGPHSPLGRITSKPSSANASPFVSPRNTPVPRSKQNFMHASSQSSFVASPNNGSQNRGHIAGNGVGIQILNAGVNTYPGNTPQNVLSQGQSSQNMTSYPGQKSTSQPQGLNLGSSTGSLEQLVVERINGDNSKSRQNIKLQRSQSVNSNTALQYLLQTSNNEPFNQRVNLNVSSQPCLETKMFAMPGELNQNSGNLLRASLNSYPRASAISISAPQSPLVPYHTKASPFDFKLTGNSLEGSGSLLEGILKRDSSQGFTSDQFLGMENNILKSIDGCRLSNNELQNGGVLMPNTLDSIDLDKEESKLIIDESSLGPISLDPEMQVQKSDTLSQEVSQFFPDDGSDNIFQKTIPNFAQLQYRSQSVPLHRMTALVSPLSSRNCFEFNFSNANSMAPTPVPTEFQDFGPEMLMDTKEGLNSDNLNQIFNFLDAQHENQVQMSLDLNEVKSENHPKQQENIENNLSLDNNEILLMGQNLNDGDFEQSLMPPTIKLENLPQQYRDTRAISLNVTPQGMNESESLQPQSNFDLSENEVCNLEMKEEFQESLSMDFNQTTQQFDDNLSMDPSQSYPNTPLPYTSTVEYVTDAPLGTFHLNTLNLHSVQARLGENSFEARYLGDELMNGTLPLMGGSDSVTQLEQEVDKL